MIIIELTVLWEEGVESALERKRLKYSDVNAECKEADWRTIIYLVEVGWDMGVTGANQRKALKDLAVEAEKSSFWLWLRRKDKCWSNS